MKKHSKLIKLSVCAAGIFVAVLLLLRFGVYLYFVVSFTQEDALEDYEYMWHTLEENYPLFPMVEEKYNLPPASEIKEKYYKILQNEGKVTTKRFTEILTQCLAEFKNEGHLNIFDASAYSSMLPLFKTASSAGDSPDIMVHQYSLMSKVSTRLSYLNLDPLLMLMPKLPPVFSPKAKNLEFYKFGDDIAYVNIDSFFGESIEADTEALFEWYSENADTKNIVIDIRQNPGGLGSYWTDLIVRPNINKPMHTDGYTFIKNCADFDALKSESTQLVSDFSAIRALPNINDSDLQNADFYFRENFEITPTSKKVLNGKIYLLVNENTASAAAEFASFCKSSGFATVAGTGTRGDGGGVQPIIKLLPNSNLLLRYRMSFTLNPDGSNNTLYGTLPDITLKKNHELYGLLEELGVNPVVYGIWN